MDDTVAAVTAFAALAHGQRLAIFRALVVAGPSGMTAGELAGESEASATATSFHLKELSRAGLIRSTRQGRYLRYAVVVDGVRRLVDYLTQDCCGGRPELCGGSFRPMRRVAIPKGTVR